MYRSTFARAAFVGLSVGSLVLASAPAKAVDTCKVKVDKKTGVIYFSAKNLSPAAAAGNPGDFVWGVASGAEDYEFCSTSCLDAGSLKAVKCTLGDPATLQARIPPSDCTLYVADNGDATTCSVWIPGCQPAARGRGTIGYAWTDQPASVTPYNPDSEWSYNAAGALNTIQRFSAGVYRVTFPAVRSWAGPHNNVQVSTYGFTTNSCKIGGWNYGTMSRSMSIVSAPAAS